MLFFDSSRQIYTFRSLTRTLMVSKLQILYPMLLCALFSLANAQNVKRNHSLINHSSPRLIIEGSGFEGDSGPAIQQTLNLNVVIANYSNDSLKYWGTNCQFSSLFNVTGCNYLHLIDAACAGPAFDKVVIPPHRSQLIILKLAADNSANGEFILNVNMNFYLWFKAGHFQLEKKHHDVKILADKIRVKFNNADHSYYDQTDWVADQPKRKLIPFEKDLHLLTTSDRKIYAVSADESNISRPVSAGKLYDDGEKVIMVPVTFHNDGIDTLKYLSTGRPTGWYYHVNNKMFEIAVV